MIPSTSTSTQLKVARLFISTSKSGSGLKLTPLAHTCLYPSLGSSYLRSFSAISFSEGMDVSNPKDMENTPNPSILILCPNGNQHANVSASAFIICWNSRCHLSKTGKPESSQSPASLHSFPILKQLLTN